MFFMDQDTSNDNNWLVPPVTLILLRPIVMSVDGRHWSSLVQNWLILLECESLFLTEAQPGTSSSGKKVAL